MSDDKPKHEHELDHGEQPLADLMDERELTGKQLVAASTEGLTFKQVNRARRGRYLTPKMRAKVQRALGAAAGETFELGQLFNYR